jgi:hypothetical protein
VETFLKGDRPIIGTTYLHPDFALGSINRGDLWNQKRPLLAYWGSARQPAYLRVRFLHDHYDFTAAQFFSVQKQGNVLAGINFAVDGGDRHPSLDRIKNGAIKAKDLRLRFEFGGSANKKIVLPKAGSSTANLAFDNLRAEISVPYAKWGTQTGHWETGNDEHTAWLDMVLHSGLEQPFQLAELGEAAAGFGVALGTEATGNPPVQWSLENGRLQLGWPGLGLDLPVRPASLAAQQSSIRVRPERQL